jgi:predicted AAA+ superfamily ATPase
MTRTQIPRELYVEKLLARRMNGFVKVITGIRRCGKSYLLGTLFRDRLVAEGVAADHIVTVDLDDKKDIALRDPLKLDDYVRGKVRRGRKPYYVFIDEIQRSIKVPVPGVDLKSVAAEDQDDAFVTFYDVLNGWHNLDNVDVYVTGSNSKTLSSDIATNFRDRGQPIRVWPLSFAEWLPFSGLTDKMEAFHRYLTWGGMPVAVLTDDLDERSDYLKGLFDEVYLRDIRERHNIKDDLVLANLIDVLSSDIGSLTNPHKIGDTMNSLWKIRPSDHTLKSYIEYLEDAFLFGHARRFEVKGRRYLDSPVKYYATDLGLRNARLNFRDTDLSHPMENAIYNELLRRGCNVDVGVVPISARDANGRQSIRQHEIDFVVNRGRDKIYIQSALQMDDAAKERQETLSLRKTKDFFKKVVITDGYGEPRADGDGIIRMGVIPFMLDETILKRL